MDKYANLLCRKLVCDSYDQLRSNADTIQRAVKMSILALYYRIGSGRRGLPWSMHPKAVWWTAGVMTAFHFAVFTVSTPQSFHIHTLERHMLTVTGATIRVHPRIARLGCGEIAARMF